MIEKLSLLTGLWNGKGTADFPTIEKTEYLEELEFKFTGDGESIFFEQRTWQIDKNGNGEKGTPLHWESGYIIAGPDGSLELLNAQNSNRVEVMKSIKVKIEESTMELSFESKYFGNDERMVRTVREYILNGNEMSYQMSMSTKNTPEFQKHLYAVLKKE